MRENRFFFSASRCIGELCCYLLADVPDVTLLGHSHEPVVDGHLVELRALLVSKERVRDPDLLLRLEAEPNLLQFGAGRVETQSLVAPRLPEVDVHLVILNSAQRGSRVDSRLRPPYGAVLTEQRRFLRR